MNGGHDPAAAGRELRRKNFPALARDSKRRSKDRLTGGCSENDKQFRPNEAQLGFEPGTASRDFARVGLLMDPAFAALFPFEMFHRVGDVNFFTVDSRFFQPAIHDFSGRTNERFTGKVFVIAWMLANQHDRRLFWPF